MYTVRPCAVRQTSSDFPIVIRDERLNGSLLRSCQIRTEAPELSRNLPTAKNQNRLLNQRHLEVALRSLDWSCERRCRIRYAALGVA